MPTHFKTKYPGVTYIMGKRLGQDAEEKIFYVRYRLGGRGSKEIREPVGRESEGMTAKKAVAHREARARGQEHHNKERRQAEAVAKLEEANRPTIARIWTLYIENRPQNKSKQTDSSFYRCYLESEFSERMPTEITTLQVDELRQRITRAGKAPQTVKHVLGLLKRLVRFGSRKGMYPMPDESRLHFEMPRFDNRKTENLTAEQLAALKAALDEEHDQNAAAFVRLALATGMRKKALMALRWDDLDFNIEFITLRAESAKNSREAKIPMSPPALQILRRIERTSSPYVFPGAHGAQRSDFKRVAQRVKEKAGLPKDFRPLHGLRHTFASWLASSGEVDIYTLQILLSQESPQMTQRYIHLTNTALQRAAKVADKIFQAADEATLEQAKA